MGMKGEIMSEEKSELLFKLRGRGLAEEVSKAAAQAGAAMRQAIAAMVLTMPVVRFDVQAWFKSFAPPSEQITLAVETMRAAFAVHAEGIGQCAFAVGEMYRQAAEMHRAVGQWAASLPDDERDELRRAIEDAPLCPVDVNASGVM